MGLLPGEILIHDGNAHLFNTDPVIGGERKARGLVPRDYSKYPRGFYKGIKAVDIPLIPRSEWPDRIKDKIANKSQLSDIRMVSGPNGGMIPSRDQNGKGYCWAHSGVSAMLLARAVMNEPYVSLSAYAGACIIKNFRDEGGWGAQGVDFLIERGVPSEEFWPQQSMSRSNDKPETWANALLHRVAEEWADLQAAQYDRNLTFDQMGSLQLSNCPTVNDYNFWSHSVCGADLVDGNTNEVRKSCRSDSGKLATTAEYELMWGINDPVTAGFAERIWNSWGESYGAQGMGVLSGSKAVPDGCVGLRSTTPSVG